MAHGALMENYGMAEGSQRLKGGSFDFGSGPGVKEPLRSTSSLTLVSSPNDTSPSRPLAGRAPVPKTGISSPQVRPPALLQAARCQLDNIPIIVPGSGPALARPSVRSACIYHCR